MQLRVIARNGLGLLPETRNAIDRRVRLTIGRHSAGIAVIQAVLSHGRIEGRSDLCHCRLRVRLRDGEVISVEDSAVDPGEAASAAAWKMHRRLDRARDFQAGPDRSRRASDVR